MKNIQKYIDLLKLEKDKRTSQRSAQKKNTLQSRRNNDAIDEFEAFLNRN